MLYHKIILATAFDSPSWGRIQVYKNHLFCLNQQGTIVNIISPDDPMYHQVFLRHKEADRVYETTKSQYILPGFIDLHIHAPQWENMGKALHVPLEVWLQTYTFPLESRLKEKSIAEISYRQIIKNTLQHGTTTAVYLGTQDKDSSLLLAQQCATMGQRAYIGKVVMDNPDECPDFYRDHTVDQALKDTEDFIVSIRSQQASSLQNIEAIITPRFTPACTDNTLKGLAHLAQQYDLPIQTHIAESNWESSYAYQRFGKSDAHALADMGLLTSKSILAHGTQLNKADAKLLAEHRSTIAHCPISNAFFGNAIYPTRQYFEDGVNAGLGSDISGGYSPSLYENIRQAILVSRLLEDGINADIPPAIRERANSRIDFRHAFYMATTAGGIALEKNIGQFKVGYAFDAQLIDIDHPLSNISRLPYETDEDCLQKILFLAQNADIAGVWVQGKYINTHIL